MLDQDFNPRLGDFGLARLITPTKNAQTTMLARTIGYMHQSLPPLVRPQQIVIFLVMGFWWH